MTDLQKKDFKESVTQMIISWLSIGCPAIASVFQTVEFVKNLSEAIFVEKLKQVCLQQDSDFDKWLRVSENFDRDSKNYEKTVKQFIYTIEAINESEMLDIYANLLCAYKADLITKDDLFRLSWVLTNIFSKDLLYLGRCYNKTDMEECFELQKLAQYGLVRSRSKTVYNRGPIYTYTISELGIKMLSCGIDYEHHGEYK